MRYARRVDANHAELAEAFRRLGCTFLSLAPLGKGAPDGAVGYGGLTILVEFKDGDKPKSKQKLTPDQKKFWDTWTGGVRLVTDLAGVEETVKVLRLWKQNQFPMFVGKPKAGFWADKDGTYEVCPR